jgi:hypothetical protein
MEARMDGALGQPTPRQGFVPVDTGYVSATPRNVVPKTAQYLSRRDQTLQPFATEDAGHVRYITREASVVQRNPDGDADTIHELGLALASWEHPYDPTPPSRKLVRLKGHSLQIWPEHHASDHARMHFDMADVERALVIAAEEIANAVEDRIGGAGVSGSRGEQEIHPERGLDLNHLREVLPEPPHTLHLFFYTGILSLRTKAAASWERQIRALTPSVEHARERAIKRRQLCALALEDPEQIPAWLSAYTFHFEKTLSKHVDTVEDLPPESRPGVSYPDLLLMIRDSIAVKRERFVQRVARYDFKLLAQGDSMKTAWSPEGKRLRACADMVLGAYARKQAQTYAYWGTVIADIDSDLNGRLDYDEVLSAAPRLLEDIPEADAFPRE